jgi:hypothetical protein
MQQEHKAFPSPFSPFSIQSNERNLATKAQSCRRDSTLATPVPFATFDLLRPNSPPSRGRERWRAIKERVIRLGKANIYVRDHIASGPVEYWNAVLKEEAAPT